ncbi:MAG: lactate utilization protein [Dehalococcoidia bacterium]|nr:lactate utilization protein [Dehalococcoidia bacterium]
MDEQLVRPEAAWLYEKLGRTVVASLKSHNVDAWYVSGRSEARDMILGMIPESASIGLGDSVTMEQLEVMSTVRAGNYHLFDRYRKNISPPGVQDDGLNKYRALTADIFLTGANAITMDGKLVCVDGAGTRVAPMLFGPKKVIVAVGANKIVRTVEDGIRRVQEVAAPMNARRHGFENVPCVKTGVCSDSDCRPPERICYYTVIIDGVADWDKGRISVVLVGEQLGF